MLKGLLKAVWLAIILPPYAFYRLIHDLIHGTSHPAWGLRTSVLCACGRLAMSYGTPPDLLIEKPKSMLAPNFSQSAWKASRVSHFVVGKGTRVMADRARAADHELIKGTACLGFGHVEPVDVPAFWVAKLGRESLTQDAKQGERVVMYFSGGGTHPTLGATCYGLARHTGLRVLALPCRPAPFPAGLLDALAGYRMLVDRGFEPQNILLVSESAGAFVCLALLRYLKELRDEHDIDAGMPGGTVMSSPACNMARFDHPVVETDFRLPFYRRLISPRLAYHFDLATMGQNPYINPAHAPPSAHTGFPPCFVQYGDCEIFSDDVRALVDGLRRDGVAVEADEVYGGLHSDAGIKRVLGYKKGSWRSLMQAVQHMGWTSELPLN